jgi:type 1 fimbriae regulatory protein FimB/type 1 fimbriae regulatory protein FimE
MTKLVLVQPENSAKSTPPRRKRNRESRSREYLTQDEVKQVRDGAKKSRNGLRDALLILMMYRHGLRVAEVIDLSWDDVHFDDSTILIRRVKNGRESVHFMEGDEIRQLRALRRGSPASRFVFLSERGGPLSKRSVHHVVRQAGEVAGLPFPVHPHMLRHSKGYQLAKRGVDTRAIQAYLGHRDIKSTVIYTEMDPSRFKGFGKDL